MIRMKAICRYIFLRLYARNLGRSRRSEPQAACSDAIMQTAMFVGLPVVSSAWVAVTLVWPPFFTHIGRRDATFLVPSIALGLLVAYWINHEFARYSATPQVADAYRTQNKAITQILFSVLPVLWLLLMVLSLRWAAGTR